MSTEAIYVELAVGRRQPPPLTWKAEPQGREEGMFHNEKREGFGGALAGGPWQGGWTWATKVRHPV